MKYLAQIVFIQILWHQFYKLYNNNLNANIRSFFAGVKSATAWRSLTPPIKRTRFARTFNYYSF